MKKKFFLGVVSSVLIITVIGAGIWSWRDGKKDEREVYVSNVAGMQLTMGSGLWNRYTGVAETQQTWDLEFQSDKNIAEWYVEEGQEVAEGTALFMGSGLWNRYTGVAETQQTWDLEFQSDKNIAEWYVEEGQEVAEGTALFRYDTAKTQESLAQIQLDLETIANDKQNLHQQIEALEKAKKKAEKEEQVSYDIELLNAQASLKTKDLEEMNKRKEMESLQKVVDTATVSSPIAGMIKSLNKTGDKRNSNGEMAPFVSVVGTGGIRIKGMVNELNVASLEKDASVIVRSRADERMTWKGTISQIDVKAPQNSMNMSGSGESTQYPFYVNMENTDGLMLGQHVLVEMDYGQEEEREGIWLDEFMIVDSDTMPYVWADNGNGKLEKRNVVLGEYDKERSQYEITSGLSQSDWIMPYVWADNGNGKLEKRNVVLGEYDKERSQYEITSGLSQSDWITFPENNLEEGDVTLKSEAGKMGSVNPQTDEAESEEMDKEENGDDALEVPDQEGVMENESVILGALNFEKQIKVV